MEVLNNILEQAKILQETLPQNTEWQSHYCSICDACGENGCCPPTQCEFKEGGLYCEWYLRDLKTTYNVMQELQTELYKEEERFREAITILEQIEDKHEV